MNKILLAFFIALSIETAFAQESEYTASEYKTTSASSEYASAPNSDILNRGPRRSSFYMNGGFGFSLTNINYNHRDQSSKIKYGGTGLGYTGELSLGVLIKEIVAVHASFEFASIDGQYNLEKSKKKYNFTNLDIDALSFLFGGGVTVFPYSRSSNTFLQGSFASAKMALGMIIMNNPIKDYSKLHYYRDSHFALGLDLEIGKDWLISDRLYMGFGIRWQFIAIASDDDRAGENNKNYEHNHMGNSLQLMLRINRK